jgi:cytochrome b6-f complex iron-sulfur subunit
MDRRNFLSWFGLSLMSSSLPFLVSACSEATKSQSGVSAAAVGGGELPLRTDGFIAVGSVADLEKSGVIVSTDVAAMVLKHPEEPNTLLAVNPRCPHAGCNVEWQSKQNAFICPCHDSKFDATGKVISGISKNPLASYQVKAEGDMVLIKV